MRLCKENEKYFLQSSDLKAECSAVFPFSATNDKFSCEGRTSVSHFLTCVKYISVSSCANFNYLDELFVSQHKQNGGGTIVTSISIVTGPGQTYYSLEGITLHIRY